MAEPGKGWHPDPDDGKGFRWHDGTGWTDYTSEVDPKYPVKEGWYADPDDPTGDMMRHWNGYQWGERATVDVVKAGRRAEFIAYLTTKEAGAAEPPASPLQRLARGLASRVRSIALLMGIGFAAFLMVFILIALLSGDDNEPTSSSDSTTTTAVCVAAEFDLAPGAPDPCASTTTGRAAATETTAPVLTTTLPQGEPAAIGRFVSGRLLDPGPIDWAISYDYRILDNHVTFSVTPSEDGQSGEVVGYGEVTHRNEYETKQFPDSDKEGVVRRLFTAVVAFEFEGTWNGEDPGSVEGTVTWHQPADRLDVEYNESTVGNYPLTDGIFTGPGPPGGVFSATWSPTTGEIKGEAEVDPWGVLTFESTAFVVEE